MLLLSGAIGTLSVYFANFMSKSFHQKQSGEFNSYSQESDLPKHGVLHKSRVPSKGQKKQGKYKMNINNYDRFEY